MAAASSTASKAGVLHARRPRRRDLLLPCSDGQRAAIGGRCQLSDIKVSQDKTGKVVQGQPEYRVTFKNLCECQEDYVDVRCNRLPSVEPIDSRKNKVVDELSMLSTTLFRGSKISFTNAWNTPQDFTVISATLRCGEGPGEVQA